MVKKKISVKGYGVRELESFKKIILGKRKEILEDLQILKESMMDVTTGEYATENSAYSMHSEQGTDAMEREKTFLFASREGKFLNYLDDALRRIEKGTYGICIDCLDTPRGLCKTCPLIPIERLEAVPHAQLCVECKNLKKGF
jgi:DnaK suppressor protein